MLFQSTRLLWHFLQKWTAQCHKKLTYVGAYLNELRTLDA